MKRARIAIEWAWRVWEKRYNSNGFCNDVSQNIEKFAVSEISVKNYSFCSRIKTVNPKFYLGDLPFCFIIIFVEIH